jgi:hypothetical protein
MAVAIEIKDIFEFMRDFGKPISLAALSDIFGVTPQALRYHLKKPGFEQGADKNYSLSTKDWAMFAVLQGIAIHKIEETEEVKLPFARIEWRSHFVGQPLSLLIENWIGGFPSLRNKLESAPVAEDTLRALQALQESIEYYVKTVVQDPRLGDELGEEYIIKTPIARG